MPQQTYLINKTTNKKFRLNGIKRSNNTPKSNQLFQSFGKGVLFGSMNLPPKVDLRADMTQVEFQAQIASCGPNALAGAYEYLLKKATGRTIDVSRLFIYYNARLKGSELTEGKIEDEGCVMADAIESLEEFGVCLESIWPYKDSLVNKRPNDQAYKQAKEHKIQKALQIDINLEQMKSCLAQGFPFVFGLLLFSTFDKAEKSGVVPMPEKSQESRVEHGSHAMLAVGYSDHSRAFIVRNSWGDDWGDKGYCYIPYDYLADEEYAFDVWSIRTLMNHDFGQEHWSYTDNDNYLDTENNLSDEDDYNDTHTIQTLDDTYSNVPEYDPYSNPSGDDFGTTTNYYPDSYQNDHGKDYRKPKPDKKDNYFGPDASRNTDYPQNDGYGYSTDYSIDQPDNPSIDYAHYDPYANADYSSHDPPNSDHWWKHDDQQDNSHNRSNTQRKEKKNDNRKPHYDNVYNEPSAHTWPQPDNWQDDVYKRTNPQHDRKHHSRNDYEYDDGQYQSAEYDESLTSDSIYPDFANDQSSYSTDYSSYENKQYKDGKRHNTRGSNYPPHY